MTPKEQTIFDKLRADFAVAQDARVSLAAEFTKAAVERDKLKDTVAELKATIAKATP